MKKLIRETECKGKEVENIIYSWENDKLIKSDITSKGEIEELYIKETERQRENRRRNTVS